MTAFDPAALAERFLAARRRRVPIPLLHADVDLTDEQAYEVQHRFVDEWRRTHATQSRGYKISVTNAEAQAGINTHEPTYGTLFEETILVTGGQIELRECFRPMLVEAELVFLIDADLPAGAGRREILAVSRVAAGLELPESRYESWWPDPRLAVMDLVADNSVAGRVVVGDAVDPAGLDLAAIPMHLTHDGAEIASGISSSVMEDPVESVVWLSRKLASQGRRLTSGSIVSSGTFTAPVIAGPGTYEARYPGVGSARVTFVG